MRFRRFEDRDTAAVRRLHHEALRQAGAHAGHGPWDDDLNTIPETYLTRGEFLVGEIDGAVVAMGALRPVSESVAEIKRMRVDPRFQRRGHGRALLRRLEAIARDLGYSTLRLDTTAGQTAARRLYASEGYVAVARDRDEIVFQKSMLPVIRTPAGAPPITPEMVAEALEDD